MNNIVTENILERRSVRSYNSDPVSQEDIEKIVECAINSQSAMNSQPWHLSVVTNKELLGEIDKKVVESLIDTPAGKRMQLSSDSKVFYNAPLAIFVAADKSFELAMYDCGMLIENMSLAARSLGIGCCTIGCMRNFLKSDEGKEYREKLGIPDGFESDICVIFGHSDNFKPAPKPREQKYIFVK